MRGDACAVFEQVVVVPHVFTFWGIAVTARLESACVPTASLNFTKSPAALVAGPVIRSTPTPGTAGAITTLVPEFTCVEPVSDAINPPEIIAPLPLDKAGR
jgi:hypothetical protein